MERYGIVHGWHLRPVLPYVEWCDHTWTKGFSRGVFSGTEPFCLQLFAPVSVPLKTEVRTVALENAGFFYSYRATQQLFVRRMSTHFISLRNVIVGLICDFPVSSDDIVCCLYPKRQLCSFIGVGDVPGAFVYSYQVCWNGWTSTAFIPPPLPSMSPFPTIMHYAVQLSKVHIHPLTRLGKSTKETLIHNPLQ